MAANIPFKEPRTKWQKSKAKQLLHEDLVNDDYPLDVELSEGDIELIYNSRDEFLLYDPEKFPGRLESLRKTIKDRNRRARNDMLAYEQL